MSPHTTIQLRKVVVKLSREGKTSREISAKLLSIGKTTVNYIINKFKTTGSVADRPRSDRPRKTTARVDKLIRRKSVVDVRKTAGMIAQELRDENLADVSRITVSRRLRDIGLFGRIGVKKLLISKKNWRARLPRIIKTGLCRIGKKYYSLMNPSLNYLEVTENSMFDDPLVPDTIPNTKYQQ
ncbi:uncharacterized protein [Anoplolepis gracilipes]|uniref:uncharacterized protein n=1 Tax=Anoplolepis gracilipes TaxID=354296 RepID=UPI003B9EB71D